MKTSSSSMPLKFDFAIFCSPLKIKRSILYVSSQNFPMLPFAEIPLRNEATLSGTLRFSMFNCSSSTGDLTLIALLTRDDFSELFTTRGFFVGCAMNSSSMEFGTSSVAGFQSRGRSWVYLITSTSDPMVCTSFC